MSGSISGRTYSDQSYGSSKYFNFTERTAGTRATALVDSFKVMHPITVVDWNIANTTLGTGGSSQWVLTATSANGTAALGTAIFVGTHALGFTLDGSVSSVAAATIAAGGTLDLYSVLSTAAGLTVRPTVQYRDGFDASDN